MIHNVLFFWNAYIHPSSVEVAKRYIPVVPTSVLTSPGMVVWFLSFTAHPKSPSLTGPSSVRKILAPVNKYY